MVNDTDAGSTGSTEHGADVGDTAPPARAADRDQRIRERAYQLWEAEGRPADRDLEHWQRASEAEDTLPAASKEPRAVEPPATDAAAVAPERPANPLSGSIKPLAEMAG